MNNCRICGNSRNILCRVWLQVCSANYLVISRVSFFCNTFIDIQIINEKFTFRGFNFLVSPISNTLRDTAANSPQNDSLLRVYFFFEIVSAKQQRLQIRVYYYLHQEVMFSPGFVCACVSVYVCLSAG